MMKNKKGNSATVALWILVIVVIGSVGGGVYYLMNQRTQETQVEISQASQAGELASLKYSTVTTAQDTPGQFAGTGYCWDIRTPSQLIESRSGKTLSATAGTTFAPVTRGNTYECAAFDSTHFCKHASGKMIEEGLNLVSDCRNISTLAITFYEDDTAESTVSINLGAGQTNTYNKFMVEANQSDHSYPIKAMCFGTNESTSHLKDMTIKNWLKDAVPDSLGSGADDYCFSLTEAVLLDEWDAKIFNDAIVFEADSTGTSSAEELLTVTVFDECEYVTPKGEVKTDYFQRESTGEADCGATNLVYYITLS